MLPIKYPHGGKEIQRHYLYEDYNLLPTQNHVGLILLSSVPECLLTYINNIIISGIKN